MNQTANLHATARNTRLFLMLNPDLIGNATIDQLRERVFLPEPQMNRLLSMLNSANMFRWNLLVEYGTACRLLHVDFTFAGFRSWLKDVAAYPEQLLPDDKDEALILSKAQEILASLD